MKYPGVIHNEEKYWIEFPDLKGYVTEGNTLEELFENVHDILFLYLESNGRENLPKPSELNGEDIIYFDIFEAYEKAKNKEIKEWIKLREAGWTFQRIADKYKVSKQYVSERLDRVGIKRKTKWSWAYEEWEKLYKEDKSLQEIAEKYKTNKTTVWKYLKSKTVLKERGKTQGKRIREIIEKEQNKKIVISSP
jgi:predicted RNase H-like HicB family nuclease